LGYAEARRPRDPDLPDLPDLRFAPEEAPRLEEAPRRGEAPEREEVLERDARPRVVAAFLRGERRVPEVASVEPPVVDPSRPLEAPRAGLPSD
jgi:hypothetical protein